MWPIVSTIRLTRFCGLFHKSHKIASLRRQALAFFPKPAAFLFGKNCAILNLHSNSCNSKSTILYAKYPVSSWRNLLTAVPSSQATTYPPKNLQLVPSMPIFRGAAGHSSGKAIWKRRET